MKWSVHKLEELVLLMFTIFLLIKLMQAKNTPRVIYKLSKFIKIIRLHDRKTRSNVDDHVINQLMNPDAVRNEKKYSSQERGKHFWFVPFNCILCSIEK